jgi:hypothetical protein
VNGNMTQHQDGSPLAGTTIYGSEKVTVARRLRMRYNVAYSGVDATNASLNRCLITDNSFSGPILEFFGSFGQLHACTITHNVIDDAFVLEWGYVNDVDIAFNIIDQPGRHTVNWFNYFGNGAFDVSYTLTNNTDGLPQNNPSIVEGAPYCVDAANGDYHLLPVTQTALDFGGASIDPDLDGKNALVDLPGIANFLGSADLGAYERQNLFYNCGNSYSTFCDGFNR